MPGWLLDLGVPRAGHVPSKRSVFRETPSPTTPIGVKGMGESGSIAAPPCMVHAVLDALSPFGIKHLDMPLTPPRLWAALTAARARPGPRSRLRPPTAAPPPALPRSTPHIAIPTETNSSPPG